MDKIHLFQEMIDKSKNIVFFGGAGVSTQSGIPDFRSVDGLYGQKYDFSPEEILSHSFFRANPDEFYRFYREKMINLDAQPNDAHKALAALERVGKLNAVITQNIDGLHQLAGSRNVFELHGSIYRNHCVSCGRKYGIDAIVNSKELVPHCSCGGIIKPDVVLYEEGLDERTMRLVGEAVDGADLLIVGGTSLNVYPAAGFVSAYRRRELVLINKTRTSVDARACLVFRDAIGDVLGALQIEPA